MISSGRRTVSSDLIYSRTWQDANWVTQAELVCEALAPDAAERFDRDGCAEIGEMSTRWLAGQGFNLSDWPVANAEIRSSATAPWLRP